MQAQVANGGRECVGAARPGPLGLHLGQGRQEPAGQEVGSQLFVPFLIYA